MLSAKLKEAAGNGLASTLYVDDVFSTWLYTGNGSTQTINNGIDLAGKGGMVWIKCRSNATTNHRIFDTQRGVQNSISSNLTTAQDFATSSLDGFLSSGFSLQGFDGEINDSPRTYASWTFRKAAKFFDVVTYTGTGANRTIAHNLGIAPGMVIVKRTDTTGNWQVYSNGLTSAAYSIQLNLTNAQASAPTVWNSTAPTSSVFSVGTDATVNASGGTYVAYLFAHDTSSTGIIQCGSVTTTGGNNVNLGWEPQYILWKRSDGVGNWAVYDSMRGFSVDSQRSLSPNVSDAESGAAFINPTATGFYVQGSGQTIIYLAIRRPNKPPTSGTQVFSPNVVATDLIGATTGFPVDLCFDALRGVSAKYVVSRLTGGNYLETNSTNNETINASDWSQSNTGINNNGIGLIGGSAVYWNFKRAPGFFDVVCYTGTGVANSAFAHNLGVTPEMMIFKRRNGVFAWSVYHKSSYTPPQDGLLELNLDFPVSGSGEYFGISGPTSTNFYLNLWNPINASGGTYVAYLFATLAGISKVGSYTGNGTTQTINCGFTGGARFVLIKRTDSNGDWYVFDTARGMTTLTDPYLLLNSTAAEVATLGAVTSVTTGFAVNAAIVAAINTNAASYIFLAIA